MLQIATKAEIDTRVNAINLTLKKLARLAGIDPMTVYRGAKRVTTIQTLTGSLDAEEIRLAQHLMTLPHVRNALADRSAA